jgi:hypothetical protein
MVYGSKLLTYDCIIAAFNFSHLHSLKLQEDCLGTNHLLDALVASSTMIQVTSFGISLSDEFVCV